MAYIPESHLKYGVLPRCRKDGGEVFLYPSELDELDKLLWDAENSGKEDSRERECLIIPYGYDSYADYYDVLQKYANKHKGTELSQRLLGLIGRIEAMNTKEDWSIVRYLGSDFDDEFDSLATGLTKGQCYYWPCSKENSEYNGVIDDEEFTAYLYPCDKDCWEVVSDPTGMAARALAGDAHTVSGWKLELAGDPEMQAMIAKGVKMKQQRSADAYEHEGWNNSEIDEISLTCPVCGTTWDYGAWTLLNAEEFPNIAKRLLDGEFFETECPGCHASFGVPHPCLYLDPSAMASAYFVVNQEMEDGVRDMFEGMADEDKANGIVRRIVLSRESLRDKALAFHNNLDDRAVELLKFGIRGSLKMQGMADVDDEVEVYLVGYDEENGLSFSVVHGDDSYSVDMERGAYELFEDALMKSSIATEQPIYVDKAWGEHALDVIEAEGTMD